MANVPKTHEDIEAQVQKIQSRNKANISEKDRIGFGESGFYFDSEIYGGVQSQYVTSIATNDEVEEEDYDGRVAAGGLLQTDFYCPFSYFQ